MVLINELKGHTLNSVSVQQLIGGHSMKIEASEIPIDNLSSKGDRMSAAAEGSEFLHTEFVLIY